MAAGSAIRAGGAFVEIFTRDSALERGLKRARAKLQAFSAGVRNLGTKLLAGGGSILAALTTSVVAFARAGSELNKISVQTGAAVDQLSKLQFVADRLNIDRDDLTGAIEELNIRLGETIQDAKGPAHDALKRLGLDAKELANAPLVERFSKIGDALKGIQNQATRGFLADEIFGGDAFKILPLLQQGSKGIDELIRKGEKLGLVMGKQQAADAVALGRAWKDLTGAFKGALLQIAQGLLPVLQPFLGIVKNAASFVAEWIKENRDLAATVGLVTVALVAGGGALLTFSLLISGAATVLGVFLGMLGLVKAAVLFLLSPIGLVVGALAGLTAAFVAFTDTGSQMANSALSSIKQTFGEMADVVRKTVGAVMTALQSGRFDLAAKVAWIGVKIVWAQATDFLLDIWDGFVRNFFVGIAAFKFLILKAFGNLWSALQVIWAGITNGIKVAFLAVAEFVAGNVLTFLAKVVDKAAEFVKKVPGLKDVAAKWEEAAGGMRRTAAGIKEARETAQQGFARDLEKIGDQKAARDRKLKAELDREVKLEDQARERKAAARQQDIDDQKDELKQTIAEIERAAREAEEKKKDAAEKTKPDLKPDVEAGVARGEGIVGSFNARVLRGSAGGDIQANIAKATEQTAKNTAKIERKIDTAEPLVFT